MKKAVLIIVAVGVVAGVGAGVFVWKKTADAGLTPVAQLLPPETVLLAELPDFPATQVRWRETALWKIVHEPEVHAFLERPRSKIPKNAAWDDAVGHFRGVKPRRAFVAITGIVNNMPQFVGGFAFGGARADVEALVAKARTQAQTASPAGKSELTKYKDFDIESFSDKGVTVAGAFARNWYFVANNTDLLKATLDRFIARDSQAAGTLAGAEVYTKTLSHLQSNPDLRYFAQPAVFFDKILALSAATGQPVDPGQVAEIRKIQAVAGATRLEGERMRDRLFILRPADNQPLPVLSRSTLGLTSPDTLFYYAFAPLLPDKLQAPTPGAGAPNLFGGVQALISGMGEQGLSISDIKAAFGPEFGIISNWPKEAVQPTLALAIEVKDAAVAQKLTNLVCGKWAREESDGATYWTAPSGEGALPLKPVVTLTDHHLLVGLNMDSLKSAVSRAKTGGDTLEKSPLFEGAVSTVSKPGNTLAYIDSRALFEHVYGWLRPMAMMGSHFIPHANDFVDVSKLPAPETIGKHLQPMVLSGSQTQDGLLMESTGPVTMYQGIALLGVAGGAAAIPILQGKIALPGMGGGASNSPAPQQAAPPAPAPSGSEPEASPAAVH